MNDLVFDYKRLIQRVGGIHSFLVSDINFDEFEVSQSTIKRHFWRPGMGTLALNADERVASVEFSNGFIVVALMDGRQLSVPLEWYPRLAGASREALANREVCGGGYGIHWPELDEDLSTEGLLRGAWLQGACAGGQPGRLGCIRT